jgi:predicted DsbA family dithiol-disulfide isomerase
VGGDVGLAADDVRTALESGRYAGAVRQDIRDGERLGLRGVPFFVFDRTLGVAGAHPVEVFRQALDQAWSTSHTLTVVAPDGEVCGPDGCPI